MAAKPVQQWEFWRAGFWMRPILMAPLALGLVTAGCLALGDLPRAIDKGRALDELPLCTTGVAVQPPCLEQLDAVLEGPYRTRKRFDSTWGVRTADGRDSVELSARSSSAVDGHAGAVVEVLGHEGEIVAVILPTGREVSPTDVGVTGALRSLVHGGGLLALGVAGLVHAAGTWSSTRSLFAVRGHRFASSLLARMALSLSLLAGVPAVMTLLPIQLGTPTWMTVAVYGAGLSGALWGVLVQWGLVLGGRGRHARSAALGRRPS